MKLTPGSRAGLTLVEILFSTAMISVLGLIVYSLLNIGTILGAKNTAMNTAHQQARVALQQMSTNLHAAVSAPQLVDANGIPTTIQPAPGISFQLWAGGPYQVTADTTDAWKNGVQVDVTDKPFTGGIQHLIIPGYQIETDIDAKTSATTGTVTLKPRSTPSPNPTPVPITVPAASPSPAPSITCFLTNRFYYVVNNGTLEWHYPDPITGGARVLVLATGINGPLPFTLSNNVVSVNLSSEDVRLSNQRTRSSNAALKSTQALLSATIPLRSILTTLP